jgi:hypothetical protein
LHIPGTIEYNIVVGDVIVYSYCVRDQPLPYVQWKMFIGPWHDL